MDPRLHADPPGVRNPYWDFVRHFPSGDLPGDSGWDPAWRRSESRVPTRYELCSTYAWSIPDPATITFVVEHCGPKVIEMGAGTGYWAWQLSQRGVDVLAYDESPPDLRANKFHPVTLTEEGISGRPTTTWHPVLAGTPTTVPMVYPDRTLLLCWPPYGESMAADALAAYGGPTLIYVGEGYGGCTGDDTFHQALEREWHEVAYHRPVTWSGIHDTVSVYHREGTS